MLVGKTAFTEEAAQAVSLVVSSLLFVPASTLVLAPGGGADV